MALPARSVLPPRTAANLLQLGWHLEHAARTLRIQQAADGAAPGSLPARLASTEELGTLTEDARQILTHARAARSELPAEIWPVVFRLEQAIAAATVPTAATLPALAELLAHRLPHNGRRAAVAAGGELARAEHTLLAMSLATEQGLAQLLTLLDAPDTPTAGLPGADHPAATLLWSETSPVSVRRHLAGLRAHLATVSGDQALPLLDDVDDLLEELAARHEVGLSNLAEELTPGRWRLAELRRSLLSHVPLRAAGLPEEEWPT